MVKNQNRMKLRCVANYYMEDGDTAFEAGEYYEFYSLGDHYWECSDDAMGFAHGMEMEHLLGGSFVFVEWVL